jgi:hypothetical protein
MTATTEVSITITCPNWCTVTAEDHAADLWDMGGVCIHRAAEVEVVDTPVVRGPMGEMRPYEPVTVTFVTTTNPEGREVEAPEFDINGHDYSLEQILSLAEAIQGAVTTYRAEGSA